MSGPVVLFAGGGTGGHLLPGVAAAERILQLVPGARILFATTERDKAGAWGASAAAELVLFPIGVLLFSRVTVAGLAVNFIAIPLMAVAQVAGMAVVPLALASTAMAAAVGILAVSPMGMLL